MNTLKILVGDDTWYVAEDFRNFFRDKDIDIEFCAKDGCVILDKIKDYSPHIVITDVFIPHIDGVALAEKSAGLEIPPMMFMALSSVDSENIISFVLNNGFDYYFVKPCSAEFIYQRILTLLNESEAVENRSSIVETLHYLGMPGHLLGYSCIKTAVELVFSKPDIIHKVTKELYPAIASMHGTTAQRVERSIRTAVEVTWNKGNAHALSEIFPYHYENYRKPSSSEFIATICEYIKTDYKKCSRF